MELTTCRVDVIVLRAGGCDDTTLVYPTVDTDYLFTGKARISVRTVADTTVCVALVELLNVVTYMA
jgi:hypothetical protein